MPPAFWPVLIISLFVVLASSRSSSRIATFMMAVIAPLVVTLFVWLLNMFFAKDYALGWRSVVGAIVIFLPSVFACVIAAIIVTLWKNRSDRKNDADI